MTELKSNIDSVCPTTSEVIIVIANYFHIILSGSV